MSGAPASPRSPLCRPRPSLGCVSTPIALACTAVRDDFASFYWTPVRTYEEELKQQKAGGFPDVIPPEIWDINST